MNSVISLGQCPNSIKNSDSGKIHITVLKVNPFYINKKQLC